jgi:hypothetical protein
MHGTGWVDLDLDLDSANMDADELCDRLDERLRVADGGTLARLSRARTSVAIQLGEDERIGITLRCDSDGVTVAYGIQPAEVFIRLTPRQASLFSRGSLTLPVLLAEGEVVCSGPVRRFLTVEPILRRLIAGADSSGGTANG